MAWYKNLTIKGKTDGFGCQLNAKLSGFAFCDNHPNYRYVHTPFSTVSHGYRGKEDVEKINEFMGIPDNRRGKKIHSVFRCMDKVFNNPNDWYTNKTLAKLRSWYWKSPKPNVSPDIVVHIRRGDIQKHRRDGNRYRRFQPNSWYNKVIPKIASNYPEDFRIDIHSEGEYGEFISIFEDWPKDLIKRTTLKICETNSTTDDFNMLNAFHDMVSAKVLVQSKSGMSYTAGIYNENDVYFVLGNPDKGQKFPLANWKIVNP